MDIVQEKPATLVPIVAVAGYGNRREFIQPLGKRRVTPHLVEGGGEVGWCQAQKETCRALYSSVGPISLNKALALVLQIGFFQNTVPGRDVVRLTVSPMPDL